MNSIENRSKNNHDQFLSLYKQHHSEPISQLQKNKSPLTDKIKSLQAKYSLPTTSQLSQSSDSLQSAWVANFGSNLEVANDVAYDIKVDKLGNIYVTGKSDSSITSVDYLTIKYNSAGVLQWTARYDGGSDSIEYVKALQIDDEGNVYVTGTSYAAGTDYDFLTVKYNTNGVEEWTGRYNGLGNSYDEPNALFVDAQGNVYVTGASIGSTSIGDYATVKYNPDGTQLWVQRYNGSGNSYDYPTAIAVDSLGIVFVTGCSVGLNSFTDVVTISYDSNGVQRWLDRYNGPANNFDYANTLAIDHDANVVVAGSSHDSSNRNDDLLIMKYSSDGIQQWIRTYNGTHNENDLTIALTVDSSGNAFVAGNCNRSGSNSDFITMKVSPLGIVEWANEYNRSIKTYDEISAIGVDPSGNVVITGNTLDTNYRSGCVTIQYNTDGTQKWLNIYDDTSTHYSRSYAIALDDIGNTYITGENYNDFGSVDFLTIKYDSTGTQNNLLIYDGPRRSIDWASAMTVDHYGNVYVTGSSTSLATLSNYVTVKYNAHGYQQWVAYYDGPIGGYDDPNVITVDSLGNVYVSGTSAGNSSSKEIATVKYDSNGTQLWATHYTRTQNFPNEPHAILVDNSGYVYVAGFAAAPYTAADYVILKYNSDGIQQWASLYNGEYSSSDHANAMAIDHSGNVYVTGYSIGSSTFYDYATLKYNSSGVRQWVTRYNGTDNNVNGDEARAIALDASGNIYITGESDGLGTKGDFVTIKYTNNGSQLWLARYNGPGNKFDGAKSLALDANGNVFVTGYSTNADQSTDFATIKYNSTGIQQWVTRYNGTGNSTDAAVELKLDASGNVYVTGESVSSDSYSDYATVKYNTNGEQLWEARFNGEGNYHDYPVGLAIDHSGNVLVSGKTYLHSGGLTITTIKYEMQPLSVDEPGKPSLYSLMQNYPNPFNPSTEIRYSLQLAGEVTITIYNILGQQIATLVHEQQMPGNHSTIWNATSLPSGIYYYTLTTQNYTSTKKMLLLR